MMRPLGGVIWRAWARAAARWGAAWAGTWRAWAAANRSSTWAARGLAMGARRMWSWRRRGSPSGNGIEEGKEDAGHFFERFVAQAGEDEGAGLVLREGGDGGAEGPGAGRIVGYVEQEGL